MTDYSETVDERQLYNGMVCRLTVAPLFENPNDAFGIFERASGHEAGTTVKDAVGNTGYWTSINYTPAELAREFARQGRTDPSREAYASLQRELHHYLHGDMLTVFGVVEFDGIELASDVIGTDYSDYLNPGESVSEHAQEVASEHFDWPAMVRAARGVAKELVDKFSKIAAA